MGVGESSAQVHALRREFQLPEEDAETLDATGLLWETVKVGGVQWLLIQGWPIPAGFNVQRVTLGIRVVQGYPAAALDMVYVHPPLKRAQGGAIAAVTETVVDGRVFQQWSRHFSPENPWRPDVDNVGTFLRLASTWFEKAVS
jgi:hypothetical protein